MSQFSRQHRKGNYMMTMGAMLPILVGFAALSVDISYISMSQMQAQYAADAAAHAAFVAYRAGNRDMGLGQSAADFVVQRNLIGDAPGVRVELDYGTWDFDQFTFQVGGDQINAAQARVVRDAQRGNPLELFFAPLLGYNTWDVNGFGVTAGRSRQIMIVQDVSCSFADDIHNARKANIAFLDYLHNNPYPEDMLGMTLFGGQVWYPPLQELALVAGNYSGASGSNKSKPPKMLQRFQALNYCVRLPQWSWPLPRRSGFPRKTRRGGECWTTQARGLIQAAEEFQNRGNPLQFQAVILVSDGLPNYGLAKGTWTGKADSERAINQLWGKDPSGNDMRNWDFKVYECANRYGPNCGKAKNRWRYTTFDGGVHVWTVTFNKGGGDFSWMGTLTRGMGRAYETPDSKQLTEIMIEIASSIPVVLTE